MMQVCTSCDTRCIGDQHPYRRARLQLKLQVLRIYAEPELKMLLSFDFSRTMYRKPLDLGIFGPWFLLSFPLHQSIASGTFLLREERSSSADLNPFSDKHLGKKKQTERLQKACVLFAVSRMCIISTWTLFAKALEGTLPCINSLRVEDKE